MLDKKVYIVKANGRSEEFSDKKLVDSLTRAGASQDVCDKISRHITGEIKDGMTTSAIYKHAFDLLHKFESPVVARYSLKRAIAELGPSGFPFEKFVAEIFKAKGFETLTDQIVNGACVDHEMDVVAWNENRLVMAEAKFHNELGLKSDLKVALYVKARFEDLMGQEFNYGKKRKLDEGLLITNTNFTEKAIQYSKCAGVRLIGWNYPDVGNLHDMIEDVGLHPITCIPSLSTVEKKLLMEKGVILCRNIREGGEALASVGLKPEVLSKAIEESKYLCPAVQ